MAGIPPLPNLNLQHPRALRLSPSLPAPYEHGGLASLVLPPYDAHVAFWRYGSRFRQVARAHYTTRSLGLLCPTRPVPGVPSTRYLSTATLPAGPWTPAPFKSYRAFFPHQQQNDLLLVNLTNPLTNIKLTPGVPWVGFPPPPIIHRTMHSTFTPFTLGPADPYSFHSSHISNFSFNLTHTLQHCHSPN